LPCARDTTKIVPSAATAGVELMPGRWGPQGALGGSTGVPSGFWGGHGSGVAWTL
jgi:hypothetical protein